VPGTPDRTGETIAERYDLLDVIGRGGQGLVYRGYDRWMDKPVAVKLLSGPGAKDPQMAERLMREQQALSALKGTSAVELFDVCRGNNGEIALVMELLSGIDLEEHLYALEDRGEHLSVERVAEIFDPIVETLDVAHHAGILHRDLKPANVFLLDYGGVRLLDFGLARLKSAAPLTKAGTIMGSPSFMAPEAWKGQLGLVDHRADVYSLGVILFRVLSGALPFSGESLHEKFLGTTKGARPSLLAKRPDLPPAADDWVDMALAIDREDRFENVRALWSAFLVTFDVEPPKRKHASLWSKAKDVVHRITDRHHEHPTNETHTPSAPPVGEMSWWNEALAKSVLPPPPELERPAPPPPPRRRPPAHPPIRMREKTVELSDVELEEAPPSRPSGGEKTLELSDMDLVFAEDTIPGAPAPSTDVEIKPAETPSEAAIEASPASRRRVEAGSNRREEKEEKNGEAPNEALIEASPVPLPEPETASSNDAKNRREEKKKARAKRRRERKRLRAEQQRKR
jgi:serine/threonine protein kinase